MSTEGVFSLSPPFQLTTYRHIVEKRNKNTQKMSYFCGHMNIMLQHMHFFFIIFAIFVRTAKAAGQENPLVDLSKREYLVELAGYGEEKLSTVLVSGAVLAYACLDEENKIYPLPVSGALVSVTCQTSRNTKSSSAQAQAMTDEYGDFIIDLPSHLHAIPDLDKACLVSVLRVPEDSACPRFLVRKPKAIWLSSAGNGIRTYTAGEIRIQDSREGLSKAGTGKALE
ncbi:hypothetical protein RJ641_002489 [Dillenia turbinata]|uniref:Uncharacterized protein n=1 Tax=Dillenia turbinata TaxID=194707 RepID=A0AAN8ZFP2_9MAGN